MTDEAARYRKALGARILSEANDLKRTREALAQEVGFPLDVVNAVIDGEARPEQAQELVFAMTRTYPIALGDLWLDPDDTDDGVVVMHGAASRQSARIFDRKGRDGVISPYYEYRDTAMSRTGPFKPEWIQPLRVVADADPENAEVAFNNGHLMHQQTFFIGEVNFYWSVGGRRYCVEMNTGDSNYITPFVPHSFTSRNPGRLGLIIAVTFAGAARRALDEFARLDPRAAESLSGDRRSRDDAYRARFGREVAAESVATEELTERLAASGIATRRAEALAQGETPADFAEVRALAVALNIRPADLMVEVVEPGEEVVLRYERDGGVRTWPATNSPSYRLTELARTRHQPGLKGFAVDVLAESSDPAPFTHGLHEYVYNYGSEPAALHWDGGRTTVLGPGDSAYIRPMTPHGFSRSAGAGEGKLCVVRVSGKLGTAALDDYAGFAAEGRKRIARETRQWF